jgi:hypothetical protein
MHLPIPVTPTHNQGALQGEPWGPSKTRNSGPPDSPALGYLRALSISSGLCLLGTFVSATVFKGAISSLPVISLLAVRFRSFRVAYGGRSMHACVQHRTNPPHHTQTLLRNPI